jgi:nucleoid-associated protein YgaU
MWLAQCLPREEKFEPVTASAGACHGRGARQAASLTGRRSRRVREYHRSKGMGIFDRKKDKPDFGNVRSGGSTTDPVGRTAPAPRSYTVQNGDTLSGIAERYYGSASKWRLIYEANRDLIKDPDLIYPGQTVRIPEA